MADKYESGDVLENLLIKERYVFVVHAPSQRKDDKYLTLDLVLHPSRSINHSLFRIPDKALKEVRATTLAIKGAYQKVDHIDFESKKCKKLSVGVKFTIDIPELEKYLRVDRNYEGGMK